MKWARRAEQARNLLPQIREAPDLLPEDLAIIAAGWETRTFPPTPSVPDGDFDAETYTALETIFDDYSRTIIAGKAEAR